jgi:tRNA dimethylallyltransferase
VTPLIAIVGPTASGKSALAVEVARALRRRHRAAEIVNADSMLVYRGMDVGTAKPSVEERAEVPHHVVDVLDVTQTATVADFQRMAREAIADCRSRGVVPILVGGSALYMRAILDDFEFPGTDAQIRSRWERELDRLGSSGLHKVLAERDPASAAAILPGNGRRIVRALEVIELTGSFSATLPSWTYQLDDVHQFGLDVPRELLDRRIVDRVDAMWQAGFVDEVRRLEAAGLRAGLTASRALGYRQVLSYLANEMTQEEARTATASGTRRFARKQLSWFRRDPRIVWLPSGDLSGLTQILAVTEN